MWTDYDGVMPYDDYTVSGGAAVVQTSYLGTTAQLDRSSEAIRYFHADLIASTFLTTDANGDAVSTLTYTAFGEPISEGGVGVPPANFGTRYQYAAGWGYESGLLTLQGMDTSLAPLTLQHVGHRWYQPDIGRFVQRDPIGLAGGANLYENVHSKPTASVDPVGFWLYGLEKEGEYGGSTHPHYPGLGGGIGVPPGGGTVAGTLADTRISKRIKLPGQKPTKNAISSLLRHCGFFRAGNLFRWIGPALPGVGFLVDVILLLEWTADIHEETGEYPIKYYPPHVAPWRF